MWVPPRFRLYLKRPGVYLTPGTRDINWFIREEMPKIQHEHITQKHGKVDDLVVHVNIDNELHEYTFNQFYQAESNNIFTEENQYRECLSLWICAKIPR